MDGLAVPSPRREGEVDPSGRKRDLALLLLLFAAALGMRAWVLTHTEVAARDSIGYIRYALGFENKGWTKTLRENHQHPGYPLAVLVASWPVRALSSAPEPEVMRLSAQLASSIAALLLVLPMYWIGKHFFNRATGFWAALVYQCLPVSGHVLSDGLSESLFLLLTAVALLLACRAVEGSSRWRFAVCGAGCGLAYLTRPEGALLLVATLFVLFVMQLLPKWRRPWLRMADCGAALVLPALAIGSPYFLTVGAFTLKPSVNQVIGLDKRPLAARAAPAGEVDLEPRPAAIVPAVGLELDSSLPRRLALGLWGLGAELVNAFHYVAWVPALLGIWWFRGRVWDIPGTFVVATFCGLHALVLWRLAVVVGYLSDRHVQILVLCGIYPAVAVVWELPAYLLGRLRGAVTSATIRPHGVAAVLAVVLLLALTSVGMPKTLQTLHAKRAGYHAAGLWLARNAQESDVIMDKHMWSHFYSGRVFLEDKKIIVPKGYIPVCYHVVGKTKDREVDPAIAKLFPNEEQVRARGGKACYWWPENCGVERATVIIYVMPPGVGPP